MEEDFLEEEPQQSPEGTSGEGKGGKENRIPGSENSMCENGK